MSIAALSSTNPLNPLNPVTAPTSGTPSALQTLVSSFNTLGQALQSGDLTGAQQAYTSLLQSASSSGAGSTASSGSVSGAAASAVKASDGELEEHDHVAAVTMTPARPTDLANFLVNIGDSPRCEHWQ